VKKKNLSQMTCRSNIIHTIRTEESSETRKIFKANKKNIYDICRAERRKELTKTDNIIFRHTLIGDDGNFLFA
jgi:hypothetical protein